MPLRPRPNTHVKSSHSSHIAIRYKLSSTRTGTILLQTSFLFVTANTLLCRLAQWTDPILEVEDISIVDEVLNLLLPVIVRCDLRSIFQEPYHVGGTPVLGPVELTFTIRIEIVDEVKPDRQYCDKNAEGTYQ